MSKPKKPKPKPKPGPKYITMFAMLMLLLAAPAFAQDTEPRGLFHDGSVDLRVLVVGKTTVLDFGVGAVGGRVDPDHWSEIDFEPTHIDVVRAGCSWGLPRSLLALKCE